MKRGRIFSFEGPEGCGKTRSREFLSNYLISNSYETLTFREPGGVALSEKIRDLLKNPTYDFHMDDIAELLLFSSARAQLIHEKIIPELKAGKIILLDRFYDSTTAYQGYANGMNLEEIMFINNLATRGIKPDITFLFEPHPRFNMDQIDVREFGQKDRIEMKGENYQRKVWEGYLKIAENEPLRVKKIPYIGGVPGETKEDVEGNMQKKYSILLGHIMPLLEK